MLNTIATIIGVFVLIDAGIGFLIGIRKGRPFAGLALGFFFSFMGWAIIGVLPSKKPQNALYGRFADDPLLNPGKHAPKKVWHPQKPRTLAEQEEAQHAHAAWQQQVYGAIPPPGTTTYTLPPFPPDKEV